MRPSKDKIAILTAVILTAAAYFVFARFGVSFASWEVKISPFWPAAGLAVALAIKGGRRHLVGIALGSMSCNAIETPLLGAVVMGLGAAASAWLGALIFRQIMRSADWLGLQHEAAAYVGASLVAPFMAVLVSGGGAHRAGIDSSRPGQLGAADVVDW